MATAGSSVSSSLLHNQVNTLRLIRLLNEAATDALRRLFNNIHPPAAVSGILNSHAIKTKITNLLHSRVLNNSQWHKLYPPTGTPDVKTFDVSLLFVLLRNICGLKPATDPIWTSYPLASDRSDEANVARVRWYRNEVIHGCAGGVDDPTFATYWTEITNALKNLGTAQSELDALEKGALDDEKYQALLLEWRAEERDLKTNVREVKNDTEEIIDSLKGLLHTVTNLPSKLEETAARIQESVKHQLKVELTNQPNNNPRDESEENNFSALRKLVRINLRGDVDFQSRRCHPGTREWIFSEVDEWFQSNTSGSRVLVLTGSPGMGKTVIAAQLSKRMERFGTLAAIHFCHHRNSRHNNPKLMLQSLACSVCDVLPEYKQALAQQLLYNVGLDSSLDEMTVEELFTLLLQEPLNAISEPGKSYLVIIDAVDEAEHNSRNELLDAIATEFGKLPIWLKFLITTRNNIKAAEKLQHLLPLQLEPQSAENKNDMYLYLKEKLQPHIVEDDLDASLAWAMQNSSGLMLHAYYLADFIVNQKTKLSYQVVRSSFPKGIASVYEQYVRRLQKELGVDESNLCNLLASIVAAKEPLHISLVPRILGLKTCSRAALRNVRKAVESISILLPVKDDRILVFHKSFVDWLQDSKVYKEHDFSITEQDGHQVLADVCSDCFNSLKMCTKSRGSYVKRAQKLTDPVVEYACIYGIHHMLKAADSVPEILKLTDYIRDLEVMFGRLKFSAVCSIHHIIEDCLVVLDELRELHCLGEVASLENVVEVLRKQATLIEKNADVLFSTFVNEANWQELSFAAKRLLSEESYSNITWLEVLNRDKFHNELQLEMNCTETIIDFDLTQDGKFAACAQEDGILSLWSLISGRQIWTQCCEAKCCKFSPDGDYIIYGYLDTVYNTKGEHLPLFPNNVHEFNECSFSPDEIRLLTLSKEGQVTMWDVRAREQVLKFSRDGDVYNSCVFSPCGKFVAAVRSISTRYSADVHLVTWDGDNGKKLGDTTKGGVLINDNIVKCSLSWLAHSPRESYICCTVHGFRNSLQHISFCCKLSANKCVNLTEIHSKAHTCLNVLQASRNARFAIAQLRLKVPNNKQLELKKSLQLLPFKTRLYSIPQDVYRLIDVSENTVLIQNEPFSSRIQLTKVATRQTGAEPVSCITMSSTGDRVYALCHETVIVYSGSTGEMVAEKYFVDTHSLYVLPNGNPVICQKETVNIYNPDLSELQVVVEGIARPVHCTNNSVLYVNTGANLHNTILSTKFDTRETKTIYKLDNENIVSGDVSEDGSTIVLGGALGTIVLVDEEPGLATVETKLPEQYPIVCKISKDCSTVVVQHSRNLFVLNAFSGELVKQIPVELQFGRYARACNFLYDNHRILMCAGSGVICICNLESGESTPVAKLHNLAFEKALFDVLSNPVSAVAPSLGLAAFGTMNGGLLLVKLHIPYTNVSKRAIT